MEKYLVHNLPYEQTRFIRYFLFGKAYKVILVFGLYPKLWTAKQPVIECEIILQYNNIQSDILCKETCIDQS